MRKGPSGARATQRIRPPHRGPGPWGRASLAFLLAECGDRHGNGPIAAGISNRWPRTLRTPLARRARGPARGQQRGPAQAFKDGGSAECGTAIVRRPDSPSPAAPAQERRGHRAWPRWVRAPRGDGQDGPARAPTPPHRPQRQRARRAPAACPERPPGAEPSGASPRAPTSQRGRRRPARRVLPCSASPAPSLSGLCSELGFFCSRFFFGCFVFWGTLFFRFPATPSHLGIVFGNDHTGPSCSGAMGSSGCGRASAPGVSGEGGPGAPPLAALCTGPGAGLGPAARSGRKGSSVGAGAQGLV